MPRISLGACFRRHLVYFSRFLYNANFPIRTLGSWGDDGQALNEDIPGRYRASEVCQRPSATDRILWLTLVYILLADFTDSILWHVLATFEFTMTFEFTTFINKQEC